MPRIPRGDKSGEIQHLISRGNGRMAVFHDVEDYRKFLDLLREAKKRSGVLIYAYCLMPNHFHLAVKPEEGGSVSGFMQWLMTSYVRYHHHKYKMSGHLWQGRYKSFLVQQEGYLWLLLRYIEANPRRAKLVVRAEEWGYSSAAAHSLGAKNPLLDSLPIDLPRNWLTEINTDIDEMRIEQIRTSVNRQAPLGEELWRQRQASQHGLETTLKPIGRPKK